MLNRDFVLLLSFAASTLPALRNANSALLLERPP